MQTLKEGVRWTSNRRIVAKQWWLTPGYEQSRNIKRLLGPEDHHLPLGSTTFHDQRDTIDDHESYRKPALSSAKSFRQTSAPRITNRDELVMNKMSGAKWLTPSQRGAASGIEEKVF